MAKDLILSLNKTAKERAEQGYDIINGVIGMMFLDDGSLPKNSALRNILSKHVEDDDLVYAPIGGVKAYRDSLEKWFFSDSFKNLNRISIATIGGAGAIFLATKEINTRYQNNILLIPDIGWPNYEGIASTHGVNYIHYQMFKNNHFDLIDLKELINKLLKDGKHISLLINDPCQNPTGYSLTKEEWGELKDYLASLKKEQINLILDLAYYDYASKEAKNNIIDAVCYLNTKVTIFLCLSCSKSFMIYGLRCGALFVLDEDLSLLTDIESKVTKMARSTWSNPNHAAMRSIVELCNNEESLFLARKEIEESSKILSKRAEIFIKELKENNIDYCPYVYGFFVTLICRESSILCENLMKKDIFIAPIEDNLVRVALCSIPTQKVYGLAKIIKENL